MAVVSDNLETMIDETYEFSAPMFFDFSVNESQQDVHKIELWFETALSYAPSPFMPKIRTGRSVEVESLCDLSDAEQLHEASDSSGSTIAITSKESTLETEKPQTNMPQSELTPAHISQENGKLVDICDPSFIEVAASSTEAEPPTGENENASLALQGREKLSTPKPHIPLKSDAKKQQTAKKIASALKPKNPFQLSQSKSISKPLTVTRREPNLKTAGATPNLAQENQAIKRQKLDEGKSRQILNVKPHNLLHKSKPDLPTGTFNLYSSTAKTHKEDRKMYVREPAAPFISTAEMVKKFQTNTRELSLSNDAAASMIQRKPKLTLTRPKEHEFETANRARSVKVKSTAEIEEEMMAKMPKFKARPVNKKILEAPSLPALPRSTPRLPEFQEFNLKTMERANLHAETSTEVSSVAETSSQNQWKPRLTEPKIPRLETLLRARPPAKIKTSEELEQEELEKIPKFKARPLNKKIFESKGELGMFCNIKRSVTKPQEFHFATDDRIPPQPYVVFDLFDKLSLNSEPQRHDIPLPRITTPNPFHLHTEERGVEKERKFVLEVMQKQVAEEKARTLKANPYPYTTDYPLIPPKPEPKQCTQPEPFQLESLVRHEEEIQRELEERQKMEQKAAQMRVFKAMPIMKKDPIPLPEKPRKPLTHVQEFNLHVEHRAVDRAEFDKKIKEKEQKYKRYREEAENEKKMEEEKELKLLRRTLVPHARPVPNFEHPFLPQKSLKGVTKPEPPKLRTVERKGRRTTASSSAMR